MRGNIYFRIDHPDTGSIDKYFVAFSFLDYFRIAGDELNARIFTGALHIGNDSFEFIYRHPFLEDDARADV